MVFYLLFDGMIDVIICPARFQKRGNRGTKKILMVIKKEKGRKMG
jgi:hypothetical protein